MILKRSVNIINRIQNSNKQNYYQRDLEQHILEKKDDIYSEINKEEMIRLYSDQSYSKGCASLDSTHICVQQRENTLKIKESNYRKSGEYYLTSLGLGSYKGGLDLSSDLSLFNSISEGVGCGGVNYIDTAINWRYMKSERVVGAAIKFIKQEYGIPRDQIVVATKCGFVPEDYDNNIQDLQFIDRLSPSQMHSLDINNSHSLNTHFLQASIHQSLINLKLETIDILYLQNLESQLLAQNNLLQYPHLLYKQIADAFELLENNVTANKISYYGLSTWNALRVPQHSPYYLSLYQIEQIAQQVAGPNHHFKFIQCPLNLLMSEILLEETQIMNGEKFTTINMCKKLGLNLMSTSPFLSGSLLNLPLNMKDINMQYLSARHLQFIRSVQGVQTTIFGAKSSQHLKKNLETILSDPLTYQEWWNVLQNAQKRKEQPEQPLDINNLQ